MLLFCCEPFNPRNPDPSFEREFVAAKRFGFDCALVDFEALVNEKSPESAVRRIPSQPVPRLGIYRGWMLKPSVYGQLFDALQVRGVQLINDLAAYRHGHHFPESYPTIEGATPKSVWLRLDGKPSFDEIMALLAGFGSAPIIVKDFVKSRKHEWEAACFIPSASDRSAVERVVRRFLELQDDDLNEGLVFREFVEFEPLAKHPKSGMPLTKEFRLFFLDGKSIFWTPYWNEGDYQCETPPLQQFESLAGGVKSRFFTMDVAKRLNSEWMVVELGDGQVAGLPENADVARFYDSLKENWPDRQSDK
jgi:hypothetical protein